ncbi:MAG TPA: ATP synthase F1 subunit epsilon [Thermoanaerobaculia bacterium]|nr:ATP synthase F1 subunit epsilon [Thermoanaerobaculia bacterium]
MRLKLVVVTPEKKVAETEADSVELPGELGYVGILPGHAPMITLVKTGVLSYRDGAQAEAFALSSGFAEVSGDRISVLADLAEGRSQIDVARAETDRSSAGEALKTASRESVEDLRAQLALAEARLSVARRARA